MVAYFFVAYSLYLYNFYINIPIDKFHINGWFQKYPNELDSHFVEKSTDNKASRIFLGMIPNDGFFYLTARQLPLGNGTPMYCDRNW